MRQALGVYPHQPRGNHIGDRVFIASVEAPPTQDNHVLYDCGQLQHWDTAPGLLSFGSAGSRGITVGRDGCGNAFVTGDNSNVRAVIYQSVVKQRDKKEEHLSDSIEPDPYIGLLVLHEQDGLIPESAQRPLPRCHGSAS